MGVPPPSGLFDDRTNFLFNLGWLWQDAYVQNSAQTKRKSLLISPSPDDSCRERGSTSRCVPIEKIGTDPITHFVMKLYHTVTTDELPVQNGFQCVELDIWPHNLFKFNPNLLVRYMPGFSLKFQNNPGYNGTEPIYTPPYVHLRPICTCSSWFITLPSYNRYKSEWKGLW